MKKNSPTARVVRIDFTATDQGAEDRFYEERGIPLDASALVKAWARDLECVDDPKTQRKLASALRELKRASAPRIRRVVVRAARVRRAARTHRRTRRAAARRAAVASGDSDGPPASQPRPQRPGGTR